MKKGLIILLAGLLILAGCSNVFPELKQQNNPPSYTTWQGIDNPDWEATELQVKVLELADQYRTTFGDAVCWDMALGLRQLLDEHGIRSILVVGKSWIESWGKPSLVLSHVWIIVLGPEGLVIPLEYAQARFPDHHRYQALTTGYFYCDLEAFEADYPFLFFPES